MVRDGKRFLDQKVLCAKSGRTKDEGLHVQLRLHKDPLHLGSSNISQHLYHIGLERSEHRKNASSTSKIPPTGAWYWFPSFDHPASFAKPQPWTKGVRQKGRADSPPSRAG